MRPNVATTYEFKPTRKQIVSYRECSNYAKACGITTMRGWFEYHNEKKGGQPRPPGIPGDPSKQYADTWQGWGHFLGTSNRSTKEIHKDFADLETVKQWFRDNKLDTVRKFRKLCNEDKRPASIPACPDRYYDVKYSELLAPRDEKYVSFEEAREFVRQFKFNDYGEFRAYRREHLKEFERIPGSPDRVYSRPVEEQQAGKTVFTPGPWTSWPDFLGYCRIKGYPNGR